MRVIRSSGSVRGGDGDIPAYSAGRFPDRTWFSVWQIQLVVTVIGVGLQDAGVTRQMRLRMLALAIARVIEDRGGRSCAAERFVVAHVGPQPPGVGFALRQHRHGRVVPVQALGRHHVGLDEPSQRIEGCADGADRVGHGRQRDRRALERVTLGLPVQRLMLAELLEHDHRQQARARPGARNDMERRRRLADLLAVAAGELLSNRLDHLPPARRRLQGPRHILAELAQTRSATAFASGRRIDDDAFVRQMVRERVALGGATGEGADTRRFRDRLLSRQFVFRSARRQLFKGERQLCDQPLRALRPLSINLALQFGDAQFLRGDQRHVFRRLGPRHRQLRRDLQTLGPFGGQRRLQGGDVVGKSFESRIHATQRIIFLVI